MPNRLLSQLDRHAYERPDQPAISMAAGQAETTDPSMTWTELRRAVVATAERFVKQFLPGEVLLVCSPNRPTFTVAFLAGLRAGLRVFPISPSLTAGELQAAAEQSSAKGIVGTAEAIEAVSKLVLFQFLIDGLLPRARHSAFSIQHSAFLPPPPPQPSPGVPGEGVHSAALLLLSSGTTGVPKIVVRSGASLDAVAEAMAESIGFSPTDVVLGCVPLCHSYGIEHGLLAPLWAGSSVRLCQGFDLPVVIAELQSTAQPVTIFPAVPFVCEMLARQAAGVRFPHLRRAYSAGGPLPEAVRLSCRSDLGLTVTQLFGATEIGSVTYSNPDLEGFAPTSVGRAMRGVEIRILPVEEEGGGQKAEGSKDAKDEGGRMNEELDPNSAFSIQHSAFPEGSVAVRAASMFTGYLDGSPDTLINGYFPTGDLGRLDAFGNLTLTGRQKLLIDVAGLKVNPLEVEAALIAHPAVAECVVVPLPVSETVIRLKAVVILTVGQSATGEQLRQFLRERLAPYKVPRVFEFREDLPRSPAGKVLRQQV